MCILPRTGRPAVIWSTPPFESYIKIVKVDAETGKTIPYAGAGFQIFRPDGSKVTQTFTYPTVTTLDTFCTNSEGYLITPETLEYGTGYSLVEVAAPFGRASKKKSLCATERERTRCTREMHPMEGKHKA